MQVSGSTYNVHRQKELTSLKITMPKMKNALD